MQNFIALLETKWEEGKFLCVGLDPDLDKMPLSNEGPGKRITGFNKTIIDATHDTVCAFKPNTAFYEALGVEGWRALEETCAYIKASAPDVPIILDAKRGDIGNTNAAYAKMAFDVCKADAVTVHPYQGGEALAPFFERKEKGVLWLVRTSNPGAGEFQDLKADGEEFYKTVARAAVAWNMHGNSGVVVGTTFPKELVEVRALIGDIPILMPGTGAQGGDLPASVKAGLNSRKRGIIISVSRAILYASRDADFADAARKKAQELSGEISAAL